jgi:hypothetical protein
MADFHFERALLVIGDPDTGKCTQLRHIFQETQFSRLSRSSTARFKVLSVSRPHPRPSSKWETRAYCNRKGYYRLLPKGYASSDRLSRSHR